MNLGGKAFEETCGPRVRYQGHFKSRRYPECVEFLFAVDGSDLDGTAIVNPLGLGITSAGRKAGLLAAEWVRSRTSEGA